MNRLSSAIPAMISSSNNSSSNNSKKKMICNFIMRPESALSERAQSSVHCYASQQSKNPFPSDNLWLFTLWIRSFVQHWQTGRSILNNRWWIPSQPPFIPPHPPNLFNIRRWYWNQRWRADQTSGRGRPLNRLTKHNQGNETRRQAELFEVKMPLSVRRRMLTNQSGHLTTAERKRLNATRRNAINDTNPVFGFNRWETETILLLKKACWRFRISICRCEADRTKEIKKER